jgi:hypothetical protein
LADRVARIHSATIANSMADATEIISIVLMGRVVTKQAGHE